MKAWIIYAKRQILSILDLPYNAAEQITMQLHVTNISRRFGHKLYIVLCWSG